MNENKPIKHLAVFCGSNFGSHPEYVEAAVKLGRALAQRKITLVYGGTNKGLMGVIADEVLNNGGEVFGVISQSLFDRGHINFRVKNYEVAQNMRERKARMSEVADAFVALPGGLGTLEEILEAATLTQLGEHVKPCGLLNTRGFYEPMRALLAQAVSEEFLKKEHKNMIVFEESPEGLLDFLNYWEAPRVAKWIGQPGA